MCIRSLIKFGLAIVGLLQHEAYAQSSVQLYGVVDGGVIWTSNAQGHSEWAQFSGVARSDRWGLLGSEDLGGGSRAIFRLENGFSVTNGMAAQGGLEFGRQALVGVANDRLGTFTLGRQYDFMTTNLTAFSAGTVVPSVFAFHLGDLDRLGGERINNAVRYVTPQLGGLQLGALYAFGGQPGDFVHNSATGFGITYTRGPLRLAGAWTTIHNYATTFGIGTAVLGLPLSGTARLGMLSTPVIFDKLTVAGVAGGYQLGAVALHGLFTLVDFQNHGRASILRTAESNAQYKLSAALWLSVSYSYSRLESNHWNQVAAGVDYFLSSRTDLYLNAVWLRANAGVTTELFLLPPSSTANQTVVALGLRHMF